MKDPARRGVDLLVRPERVEASLWRTLLQSNDEDARRRVFDHYRPFAHKLAMAIFARRPPDNFERADVEQLAYEGLLQAIARYDPARNIAFESFARKRITGHIQTGLAAVSEGAAQYRYHRRAERERLRSLASPGLAQDSDPLTTLAQLSSMIALGLITEATQELEPDRIADPQPSAYESLAWHELKQKVRQQISALPEREEYVVTQHYRNGVSFQQIAEILEISKSRVSQIHRSALLCLREQMNRFR